MAKIIADDPDGFMPGMSADAVYHSRHQFRAKWYEYFRRYTLLDPTRLVRDVLSEGDIYVGHRSRIEFSASEFMWHVPPIWVTREGFPREPTMELRDHDHGIIIHNTSLKSMHTQAIGIGLRYGWRRIK